METDATFKCVVIAPPGKLLDCPTTSVVFPAHDGYVGILYNHIPMLCKLGLGIMKVTPISEDPTNPEKDVLLLIDGGFALVGSNIVTLTSYDAISFKDIKAERIESMLQKQKKKLTLPPISPQQTGHDIRKLALMAQLAQIYKHPTAGAASNEPAIPEEILNG
jgi:F-type H+-transporting ATPase subunit epsilon